MASRAGTATSGAPNGGDPGAELTLAFVGELVADQLSVEAIHRLYTGITADELADAARDGVRARAGRRRARSGSWAGCRTHGRLVLVDPDGWEWLIPSRGAFDGVRALDGLWLEHALDGSAAEVTYQHGLDETVAAVRAGDAAAAVLIRPVSVEEIERTAREGGC